MIRPPLTGMIYVEVAFSICQSLEPGHVAPAFFGASVLPQSIDDADAGVALTVALDERVEGSGIGGMQPDAAMRSRRAEATSSSALTPPPSSFRRSPVSSRPRGV